MHFSSFLNKYKSIVGFLIIEILALVCFNFANITQVFYLIAALLSICAFVFSFFTNVDRKDYIKLIPVVAGLFIISGIASFGGFSTRYLTFYNVALFFTIPGFFSLGFFARRLGDVKAEHVVLAIGFGLAAITFVGMMITWIEYGPFYAAIYKSKPTYFYDGMAYNVTKEMGWLMGFKVTEVTVEYGSMFAIMCAVFLPALLFINIKENRNLFICSAVIGAVGFVALLTIPNWKAIILLAIISAFAFIYKFLKEKKLAINIISLCVVIVLSLGVLFYFGTILNAAIGFKFTGIFDRLMVNNSIMKPASNTLSAMFAKDINGGLYNLFGFNTLNPAAGIIKLETIINEPTYIFEYEIVKEVGFIGTIFVVAFLIAMFVFMVRYIRDAKDSGFIKNTIVMMLLAFFMIATIGFDIKIQPQNPDAYQAFTRSIPFMISLFLFGYIYFVPEKVEFKQTQKVEEATL